MKYIYSSLDLFVNRKNLIGGIILSCQARRARCAASDIYLIILTGVLLLSACGSSAESAAAPTQNLIEAAHTSAVLTVQAQAPAQTSTPAFAPTFAPATLAHTTATQPFGLMYSTFTPAPATPTCHDAAQYMGVGGTETYKPHEKFTRTWTLKNAGTCTWDQYYDLVFANQGDPLSAPSSIAFISPGITVSPGSTVDVSVSFTAPSALGTYQSFWSLVDGYGSVLPVQNGFTDSLLYTEIVVSNQSGGGGAGVGRIVAAQFNDPLLLEGSQCGADAAYMFRFTVAVDAPVVVVVHFSTRDGYLNLEDDTYEFTEAGAQTYDLTVWGPYNDPARIKVSVELNEQPYGSQIVPCP